MEGVLITTKGSDQLILSISLLQRSVAVAVDRRWVRPLANESAMMTRKTGPSVPFERDRVSLGR